MISKKRIVPSLFTMLNLFFGFFAIVHAVQGNVVTASWLIIIAAVWDALDGKVARMTQTYSEFGIEFDSLADVVSFGVGPSVLIYQVYFYKIGPAGVVLSFLPVLFGAIRLARFNVDVDGYEKENYSGLPIPFMAVTVSAYVIFNYDLWEGLRFPPFLASLVVLLSILMVSNVEYEPVPRLTFREDKKNSILLAIVLLGIVATLVFRQKVMFPMLLGFVLYGLFRAILQPSHDEEEDEIVDVTFSD